MGDLVLGCAGGTPGLVITGNLSITLSVPVTNRLTPGTAGDIVVTVDTGSGPLPAPVAAQLLTPQVVSLNGFSFTTPPSGPVTIRVNNLRGNVSSMATGQVVIATVALNGLSTITLVNNPVVVAVPQRGLLANASSTTIRCVGSPLPATISMTNLFVTGTHFESTRLTEGFASAFQTRGPMESAGTRFIIRYTNVPAGILLYVPDAIAGSDALQPTAGGDLGTQQALGRYVPGSNTLLLSRVPGADTTGNGGSPIASGNFDSASPVALANGSGFVVYEVLDSNPTVQENAQFPTFVGTATTGVAAGTANESISFAPVSTDSTANSSAPVPRFVATQPPSDCQSIGDCGASYFPSMAIFAQSIVFTAIQGGLALQPPGYIAVQNPNAGQSILNWVASIKYQNGSDWLTLENPYGLNNGSIRVWAQPQKLAPGTYSAFVIIDGGTAGIKSVPVTLVVTALPPVTPPPVTTPPPVIPPVNTPAVTTITNGANFLAGPVVAGSIATLKGSKFIGKSIAVTFDGVPAKILFTNDTQVNVQVPDGLGNKSSAQVLVTVDGQNSPAMTVPLALVSPAVFDNGILNQDNSGNNATNGALVSSIVQIFLTGLPETVGTVMVKIHDRDDLVPVFAGAAPGIPGVYQVNVAVPGDLPAMTTTTLVCGLDASNNKVCSAAAPLTLITPEP